MYSLTVRTRKYDTQLLVKEFSKRTGKTIKRKVRKINIKELRKRMVKLFGMKQRNLSLPLA